MPPSPGPTAAEYGDNRRFRILVAEDNRDLSQILIWLLYAYGFEAQAVLSGNLVLEAARSFRPHFLLLDIGLPGLDGYQVAEQIRADADLNAIVIIAVSGYGPDMNIERCRRAGFDHHLTKPVIIETLLPLLKSSVR